MHQVVFAIRNKKDKHCNDNQYLSLIQIMIIYWIKPFALNKLSKKDRGIMMTIHNS